MKFRNEVSTGAQLHHPGNPILLVYMYHVRVWCDSVTLQRWHLSRTRAVIEREQWLMYVVRLYYGRDRRTVLARDKIGFAIDPLGYQMPAFSSADRVIRNLG